MTARPAPLLDVRGLEVSYGPIRAVRGVDLTVGEGEIVALVGANGAGKSSILRAVSGMVRPAAGRVLLAGDDVTRRAAHELVPRGLAHAPEGRGVFLNLTVEENLALGSYLRRDRDGIASDRGRMLELFPVLRDRLKRPASTLSGGEQQMLAVARALMSRPRLLLLDEPSLGLAPQVVDLIFRTLVEVNATGVSILLVEQNARLALATAGHAYVLETGALVMQGPGRELLQSDEIRRAYLGE